MDRLQRSCDASDTYPLNLEGPSTGLFYLRHERELLRKISPRTFADETKAHLDFWEYQQDDFSLTPIKSQQCLRDHLNRLNQAQDYAPLHRFVFIQASSSRTKLLISEDMLKDLLSYFQVMAALIPLLASFGIDAGEDFQHCQFESNVKLSSNELGLAVPELKRSGRTIEIAYVFRTVEPSKSIEGIPWQIKQTCVYHSFDVETGLNTWIFVKGSDLVKNRVMDGLCLPSADTSPVEAFLFSLSVQSMLSNLSLENWRTYVNSLEQKAQIVTTALTFKPVEIPETPIAPAMIAQHGAITPLGFRGRSRSLIYNQLSRSSTLKSWMSRKEMSTPVLSLDMTLAMTDLTAAQTVPPSGQSRQSEDDEERTYFKCLQDMKWLEEQALEALLVLKMTVRMWKQLQRTYEENVTDEHFPHSLRHGCRRGLKQFLSRLDNVEDALENQVLRVEALIALLSGRKNLLHSILEWRNVRAGNDVAIQATKSSIKMEEMTARMQDVANRTEKETVSMRIITLVTMFFLPGTFISTLMSTDIIRFSENHKVYSPSALKLFLAISLPMMGATFFAWYVVYLCTNRRETVQRAKKRLVPNSQV